MKRFIVMVAVLIGIGFVLKAMFGGGEDDREPKPFQAMHAPNAHFILTTIEMATHNSCGVVTSFQKFGSSKGWDYYIAACGSGARFVYMQSGEDGGKVGAMNCADAATQGLVCP